MVIPMSSQLRTGLVRGAAGLLVALAVVVPVTGCVGSDGGSTGGSQGNEGTHGGGLNALVDPGAVPGLIAEHIGKNPTIRRLSLNDNGFSLEVRDPDKPDNLDTYVYYNGSWSTSPVFMSKRDIEQLGADTFKLSKVNFDLIPQFLGMASEGLDLEGEQLTGVSFDRVNGDPVRVYVSVRGVRGSGHLLANADGTHAEVTRD